VLLAADRLECGGVEAWFGGQLFKHVTCALNGGIWIVRVDDVPLANDVVCDDGAGSVEADSPVEVVGVVGLVGR
jgi:hypothetical protein